MIVADGSVDAVFSNKSSRILPHKQGVCLLMDQDNHTYSDVSSEYEETEQSSESRNAQSPKNEPPAPSGEVIKIASIQRMDIDQLNAFARTIGLKHIGSLTRSQLVFEVVKSLAENPNEILYGEGVLEVLPDGFGFLRSPNYNYLPSAEDIYISPRPNSSF